MHHCFMGYAVRAIMDDLIDSSLRDRLAGKVDLPMSAVAAAVAMLAAVSPQHGTA